MISIALSCFCYNIYHYNTVNLQTRQFAGYVSHQGIPARNNDNRLYKQPVVACTGGTIQRSVQSRGTQCNTFGHQQYGGHLNNVAVHYNSGGSMECDTNTRLPVLCTQAHPLVLPTNDVSSDRGAEVVGQSTQGIAQQVMPTA